MISFTDYVYQQFLSQLCCDEAPLIYLLTKSIYKIMEVTKYELLVVSKIGESDGLLSRVEKALKDASATELKSDKLGKKVLAYPIKKQTEADYTIFTFNVEGSSIKDLTDLLRLEQEALLRYLILTQKTRKLRKKVTKHEEKVVEKKEESKPKVTVVTKTKAAKVEDVSTSRNTKAKKAVKSKKETTKKAKK